jgi:peptidoglycan/LPS O-acetylase OafA/YrhL
MESGRPPAESEADIVLARRHLPALDGIRCLAITGVVWHHSLPRSFPGWLGRGHAGVPLFFALSGFLITRLLIAEQRATGHIDLGQFWLRRSLRILPLYYAVLAGFVLLLGLRAPTEATRHFFASLPFYASYTSNWFVEYRVAHPVWFGFAWSLATEEQFYAWWPLLLRWAEGRGRWLAPLGLLTLLGLDQLAERMGPPWLTPGEIPARVATSLSAAMLLGALLALALAHPRGGAALRRALAAPSALPLAIAAAAALLWRPLGPPILLELAFATLVGAAALTSGRGALARLLSARPLVHVGRVSYGVYLFHVPVLGALKRTLPVLAEQPLALFPAAFALSIALASASYRYLEGPLLALRERFRPASDTSLALRATGLRSGWLR